MIMIDIFVPGLYRAYDFELNENIKPKDVLMNACGILEKQLDIEFESAPEELFSFRKGAFLKQDMSLKEQEIKNADRLILI